MSEKYDGVRACWSPVTRTLYQKNSIMNPSTLTVRLDTLDLVDLCTLVMPILPHFQWEFF